MRTGNGIIVEKISDEIGTSTERLIINSCLSLLCSYSKFQLNFSIRSQQRYIEDMLYAVDYLYQIYDLQPIYFSLLDHAARTLEKLASAEDQREMLAEYFDKTAVVFLTAADKTRQDPIYKQIWSEKAKEYKSKADSIRGITPNVPCEEGLMQLYRIFAESIPHKFIKNLLLDNYRRYENRYMESEPQPSGLRHSKTENLEQVFRQQLTHRRGETEESIADQTQTSLPPTQQLHDCRTQLSVANLISIFASWYPLSHFRKKVEETSEKQRLLTQEQATEIEHFHSL